jgi:hypothetical protein
MLLTGLNAVEPLLSYATANCIIPDLDSCRPSKDIVLEVCYKEAWRRFIGFDGPVTSEEFQQGLDRFIKDVCDYHAQNSSVERLFPHSYF